MKYGDHNFDINYSRNYVASRACRSRRVEPVELVVSSESSRAVRQSPHSQNAWARHVERVESCRVKTWRTKWNLGYKLIQGGSRIWNTL